MLLKLQNVLKPEDITEVRKIVEAAEWVDGTVSGDPSLKRNLQVARKTPEFEQAIKRVASALMAQPDFLNFALPKQITLEFNRYDPGMFYKDHMDAALMGNLRGQPMRTDLSVTVALTDPADYQGGDFVAQTPFGEERVKLAAGSAIVYPSNMIHRVEPIEGGCRWSVIGWIQSMVRDPARRDLLFEINRLRDEIREALPEKDYRVRFDHLRGNLLRFWAEV